MPDIPIYTLSNISGETGVLNHVSSNFIAFSTISGENVILNYDEIPSTDPNTEGQVWRDSNGFLKISSG